MRKTRYTGKYTKAGTRWSMTAIALVLICVAVLAMASGGVWAYLSANLGSVNNTFEAAQSMDPSIMENFDNTYKSDVKVSVGQTGYAVYVRAAVVITWKSGADGDVLGSAPVAGADGDYTILYNTDDWFYQDGFWYCEKPVESEANTPILIRSCAPNDGKTPEGYGLNVEIITQTIQALGTTDPDGSGNTRPAVTAAWGIPLDDNGELTTDS